MPMFAPATDTSEVELPEPGKYIVTCVAIEDAPDKGFGPGVKWVFKLSDPATGITYQSAMGGDYELWQFTSVKMGPKGKARPIIEALLGRPLDVAKREVPDVRQLLGAKMQAIVIHEKRDDGTDKAVVTSCKPYSANVSAPSAPPASSAAPAPAPSRAQAASGVRDQVRSLIRKSQVLGTPNHLEWGALNVDMMTDGDLYQVQEQIIADIAAA